MEILYILSYILLIIGFGILAFIEEIKHKFLACFIASQLIFGGAFIQGMLVKFEKVIENEKDS